MPVNKGIIFKSLSFQFLKIIDEKLRPGIVAISPKSDPPPVRSIETSEIAMETQVRVRRTMPRTLTPLSRSTQQQHFVKPIF